VASDAGHRRRDSGGREAWSAPKRPCSSPSTSLQDGRWTTASRPRFRGTAVVGRVIVANRSVECGHSPPPRQRRGLRARLGQALLFPSKDQVDVRLNTAGLFGPGEPGRRRRKPDVRGRSPAHSGSIMHPWLPGRRSEPAADPAIRKSRPALPLPCGSHIADRASAAFRLFFPGTSQRQGGGEDFLETRLTSRLSIVRRSGKHTCCGKEASIPARLGFSVA